MIGKSEWFNIRKKGGWGLSPKTWQGYVYAISITLIIAIPQFIVAINLKERLLISGFLMLLFLFDVLSIMSKIKLDEREAAHQAQAEKNASLAMVFGITLLLIYEIFLSIITSVIKYELLAAYFIILLIGYIAKTYTYYKLEK